MQPDVQFVLVGMRGWLCSVAALVSCASVSVGGPVGLVVATRFMAHGVDGSRDHLYWLVDCTACD
jgi:hypothetical protein